MPPAAAHMVRLLTMYLITGEMNLCVWNIADAAVLEPLSVGTELFSEIAETMDTIEWLNLLMSLVSPMLFYEYESVNYYDRFTVDIDFFKEEYPWQHPDNGRSRFRRSRT
jgi:hypothetical protein